MRFGVIAFAVVLCWQAALAQGPRNILLVVNQNSAVSGQVADYYRQRRGVPATQVCSVRAPEEEEIDRAVFDRDIRQPLANCLARGALHDRVLYIVLTKGVPLKIKGSGGREGDQASVDSELTLLYSDLLGVPRQLAGRARNPYYGQMTAGRFSRFSHALFPIYLVTRLDGYSLEDIRGLIDRALSPRRDGRFILDLKADDNTMGNDWLRLAAERLQAAGIPASRIVLETSTRFLTGEKDVLGYASWGSNDHADTSRFLRHGWVNGALLAEYVSSDARTFQEPPQEWDIAKWSEPEKFYKGSPQSLIADSIHEGVTGAAGYVYEPYLDTCIRPQILFPAYVSGLNLAESYYLAMPYLSWQTVVVGDPLAAPFPGPPLPREQADPATDRVTELPTFFSERLVVRRAAALHELPGTVALVVAAERKHAAGDEAGARAAAEKALAADPTSVAALFLAASLEQDAERTAGLYRKLLDRRPDHAPALNNLAYLLATRRGQPAEALPLAARADELTGGRSASVIDTHGWVLFLLEKHSEALPLLQKAAALEPANALLAFHLGMCLDKLGRREEALAQLKRALSLNPDAETAAEIQKQLNR
jgi:uncharacterized protein (TIGR03790 family)